MYHDENGSEGPKGTFEIYRAEAESLYKQGEYRKAIESFTIALELTPEEKNCLVARSKCYLQLGDMQSALADAETSLSDDKDFHKGIYQKAQALYYQGDFEMALVFYHRGHKLRPELQEFRLGIQKAQEAIDNSVGCKSTTILFPDLLNSLLLCRKNTSVSMQRRKSDWSLTKVFTSSNSTFTSSQTSISAKPSRAQPKAGPSKKAPDTVKLTTEGDLSYFDAQLDDKKIKRNKGKTYGRPVMTQQAKSAPRVAGSEKTIKQLLGELYGDRMYLEKLLKETDPNTDMGKTISTLVNEGLSYLDTRSDFWRQQKPMYARRHDRIMQRRKREVTSNKLSPNDYILKELERIDQAQVDGRYQEALKRSQKCLSTVQNFSEDDVPNKVEVVSNLHSCIGNAHLELGQYDKALDSHNTDLMMGETNDMLEAVSRGLDNIGRVHARRAEFAKAIAVWERKLPMSKSPLESTWLYHEIGRCYLEINKFSEAKNYGEQSDTAALEAEDQMWQLQASVLIAQAEVKLNLLQAACATFEKAQELAKSQGDKSAETAIKKAIDDINTRILAGEGVTDEGDENKEETNRNASARTRDSTAGEKEQDQKSEQQEQAEEKKDGSEKGDTKSEKAEEPAVVDNKTDDVKDEVNTTDEDKGPQPDQPAKEPGQS